MSSIDSPVPLVHEPADAAVEDATPPTLWAETALTVTFTAAAVLFVSFIAVVTGLV